MSDSTTTNVAKVCIVSVVSFYTRGDITTEFYSAGTFTRGPDLPLPFNDHCLVEFEPGRVFISGSSYAAVRNAAIIYDLNTETFERLADMVYQRYNHGCGAINTGSS